jgi:threonine/homoserine/homoserine lactone efflux protein
VSDAWSYVPPAFALGFALGAAPGPVQVLILSQTAQRGFGGGVRVMLGANLTLYAILLTLALGLSAVTPSDTVLRVLRASGGVVLIWIAISELRTIWRPRPPEALPGRWRALGPTEMGILMVLLNPGAWIFFATTASSVLAGAAAEDGRPAAVLAATAMAVGVSASDFAFTLLGSGGHRLFGERGLRWIRSGLAGLLAVLGVAFVVQGVTG